MEMVYKTLIISFISAVLLGCGADNGNKDSEQPEVIPPLADNVPIDAEHRLVFVVPTQATTINLNDYIKNTDHARLINVQSSPSNDHYCPEPIINYETKHVSLSAYQGQCSYQYQIDVTSHRKIAAQVLTLNTQASIVVVSQQNSDLLDPITACMLDDGKSTTISLPNGFITTQDDIQLLGAGEVTASESGDKISFLPYNQGLHRVVYRAKSSSSKQLKTGVIDIAVSNNSNKPPEAEDFTVAESGIVGTPITIDVTDHVTDPADPENDQHHGVQLIDVMAISPNLILDFVATNNVYNREFTVTPKAPGSYYMSYLVSDHHGGFDLGLINFNVVNEGGGGGGEPKATTMSAGYQYGLFLDNDNGYLWAAGTNSKKQLGFGKLFNHGNDNTNDLKQWTRILVTECGGIETVGSGQNKTTQCKNSYKNENGKLKSVEELGDNLVTFSSVASSMNPHSLVSYLIDSKGSLWVSGTGPQLGLGDFSDDEYIASCFRDDPQPPQRPQPIQSCDTWAKLNIKDNNQSVVFTMVSVGNYHSYALDQDGNLWSVGKNESGELGLGEQGCSPDMYFCSKWQKANIDEPDDEAKRVKFIAVVAGPQHGYAIDKNNNLWVTGSNSVGQLGLGEGNSPSINAINAWTKIPKLEVQQVRAGGGSSVADSFGYVIDMEGNVWATGQDGGLGNLSLGDGISNIYKWQKNSATNVKFKDISASINHGYALDIKGKVWAVGSNAQKQLGLGINNVDKVSEWTPSKKALPLSDSDEDMNNVIELNAGGSFGYARDDNNKLWVVGENQANALGLGTAPNSNNNKPLWVNKVCYDLRWLQSSSDSSPLIKCIE